MKIAQLFLAAFIFAGLPAIAVAAIVQLVTGSDGLAILTWAALFGFGLSMMRPRPERGERWRSDKD